MALKNLSSLYDLVGGNQPVGDMENQQGGIPFDLGNTSTLQQDSLSQIPVDSPYQDLNGEPGPQFDLGENSTLQEDNLVNLASQLDYPDLNNAQFGNGLFGSTNNPGLGQGFQLNNKDLHVSLLENNYTYTHGASQTTVQAGTFDLDGGLPSSGKYVDKFDKLR